MSERKHWSSRLKRNYEDGDLLSVPEVIQVLSANSSREVSDRAVSDLARRLSLTRERPSPRAVLYHYEEVKNLVVAAHGGRRKQEDPTDNALRQRKFRAKRGTTQDRGPSDHEMKKAE